MGTCMKSYVSTYVKHIRCEGVTAPVTLAAVGEQPSQSIGKFAQTAF